jgi:hypothetical protein
VRNGAEEEEAGEEGAEDERGRDRASELEPDVEKGESPFDPLRGHESERDRGVEVPAGDVAEVRDHDPDGEAVGQRDRDDVLPADDAGAAADEDEGEGADELGDAATELVLIHGSKRYERRRTE